MDKILVTPVATSGVKPFEVEGKLTSKRFNDCGLIYYIGGQSFPEKIVTILHREGETENCNQEENLCEHCSETDLIIGFNFHEDGNLDIRFDPENAEIDIIYLHKDIDHSIGINYCPFCGKKLR